VVPLVPLAKMPIKPKGTSQNRGAFGKTSIKRQRHQRHQKDFFRKLGAAHVYESTAIRDRKLGELITERDRVWAAVKAAGDDAAGLRRLHTRLHERIVNEGETKPRVV
jgi:hypothetical protein